MEEEYIRSIAGHLRKPDGETGKEVASHMNTGNAAMNRFAINQLDIRSHDRILEIGMGNGFFVKEMLHLHPSITYTGCDYSQTMVEEARKLNESFLAGNRVRFYNCTADQLPFENQSFDKVLSVNTLYFWDNPLDELSEIARVLKAGGKLVLCVRSKKSLEEVPFTRYGFTIYSQKDIISLFAKSPLQIVNIIENTEHTTRFDGQDIQLEAWAIIAEIKSGE